MVIHMFQKHYAEFCSVSSTAQKHSALRITEVIRYLNLCLYLNQKVFQALKLKHSLKWPQPSVSLERQDPPTWCLTSSERRQNTHSLCSQLLWFSAPACIMQRAGTPQTHCWAVQTDLILFSLLVPCLSPFWQESSPT